jgi:hypothetical protein
LKDYLHRTPVPENEKHWPSPEALARKILIKGKKLPNIETLTTSDSAQQDSISESCSDSGDERNRDSDDELSESDSKHTPVLRRHSNTDVVDRAETESEQIISQLSEHKALGNNMSIQLSLKSHSNSSTKVN